MGLFVFEQKYDSKKLNILTKVYQCPFFRTCECVVEWKMGFCDKDRIYQLFCNVRHHRRSHVNYNGRLLGLVQKAAVARAVQNDPNCTGTSVMRNIANIPDDVI